MPPISVLAVLLEQTQRISRSSKTEVKRFIEESESMISALESQITTLELESGTGAGVLVDLRDRERITVAALRHLIAPIRTLPVELLAEIFMLSFRKFLEFFHYIDAFRLSHVCADWRQVANGTPQLWTGLVSLVITNRTLAKMHDTRNVDAMKAWLARSAPLAIPVLTSFELEGPDVTLPPVLAEVLKISPRWRSLKMSRWAPASYFTCLAERGLDNLEELDLSLGSDFDYTILPSFSILAPRLRKLHMNSHCRTSMPWAQLTDISLSHGPSPDIALGILAQCPSLVKVDINTVGWSTLPQLGTDVITLQHLRTLLLAFIGSDGPHERHFMPFLERLSAPTLELLNLNIPLPHLIWPRSAFTAFQLLSPNMTQLAIVASDALTSDDLRAALFHAPLLTHLTLHHSPHCIDDALLRALTYEDGAHPLVPNLHTLIAVVIEGTELSIDLLSAMIASRWWTDDEAASHLAPPAVARWEQLKFQISGMDHNLQFTNLMRDLKRSGVVD